MSANDEHEESESEQTPTLSMIYKLLTEMKTQMKKDSEEMASIKKGQKEVKEAIESLREEKEELKRQNTQLQEEVKILNNKIEKLDEIQDNLNQYQRKHNLELHGIPEKDDEDLENVVEELAKELGIDDIDYNDIDIVHRLHSRKTPRPIIVKFKSYDDKKNLYQARYKLKKWKNPNEEKLNGATRIYINENLTPARKQLFNEVRKRAKQHRWYSVFTIDGKIFIKREKGQKNAKITKEADLEQYYF